MKLSFLLFLTKLIIPDYINKEITVKNKKTKRKLYKKIKRKKLHIHSAKMDEGSGSNNLTKRKQMVIHLIKNKVKFHISKCIHKQ